MSPQHMPDSSPPLNFEKRNKCKIELVRHSVSFLFSASNGDYQTPVEFFITHRLWGIKMLQYKLPYLF